MKDVFDKTKKICNSFFETIETKSVNRAMKTVLNWRLKHRYMCRDDHISSDYRREIKQYWSKYKRINTRYHKYYSSRNGIEDVRYIPDDLYYTAIDQYFNRRKYGWGVNDKNYYDLWFAEARRPDTLVRKINGIFYDKSYRLITREQAIALCETQDRLIIKPSLETGGGRGILFWNKADKQSLEPALTPKNIVVQKLIVQHEKLSRIHSASVNTVRTISLLSGGKVHILSSVLRMGVDGSRVDNASAGGITCGIEPDGQLKNRAFSAHGVRYDKHPQGYLFNDCIVPSYGKAIDLVRRCHEKMGHFRLISWDIAIDADGEPVLIEANLRNGECDFHQFNNGPLFGDLTDQVLEEVFNR